MKHVALLRGVNVGGKNLLPMKELAAIFVDAGCKDVCTYIQSGNVVFNAPAKVLKGLSGVIGERVQQRFGYRPAVILRSSEELGKTIAGNPFLLAGEPEMLHVYFLAELPEVVAVGVLDPDRSPPDRFHVAGREIYLHLPAGLGKSKLTNGYFDSKLRTVCTARNWATVLRLFEMTKA
jgi:uncharacterized protein (DUF1697 family)